MVSYWLKIAYFCKIFPTPLSFGALVPYVPFGGLQLLIATFDTLLKNVEETKILTMVRKVRRWYEKSVVRTVRKVQGRYEKFMVRIVHGTKSPQMARNVYGTKSLWYEKSGIQEMCANIHP